MNFDDAINEIKKYYDISAIDADTYEIFINKMFDDFNFYFLVIRRGSDNSCYLSDYAKTAEIIDITENELKFLAEKNNLTFNDFYIKKNFTSIKDIENFIIFFDEITKILSK